MGSVKIDSTPKQTIMTEITPESIGLDGNAVFHHLHSLVYDGSIRSEILCQVLFDMRRDVTELKKLVHDIMSERAGTQLRQLNPSKKKQ